MEPGRCLGGGAGGTCVRAFFHPRHSAGKHCTLIGRPWLIFRLGTLAMILDPNGSRLRSLALITKPARWPCYPFLPLVRHRTARDPELAVLYDAWGVSSRTGYSATVFLQNVLLLPATESELLSGPREVFDTLAELLDAGW